MILIKRNFQILLNVITSYSIHYTKLYEAGDDLGVELTEFGGALRLLLVALDVGDVCVVHVEHATDLEIGHVVVTLLHGQFEEVLRDTLAQVGRAP